MAVSLWGQSTLLSTTVSASPTPTTTVFTVASITGFMGAMYIEVMVGGIYYRRQISSITGSQITLGTALPGVPDTPGGVQFKGELITNDHLNEMVNAINDNTTDVASAVSRYGGGIHGLGKLGALSNPVATVTAADGGAGNISGTVRYRATFFNLSGETTATADPGSDLTITSKQITVGAIPVSGDATCQGRGIYRSKNAGSTWHLVGRIYDNTTTTWTDNNNYTGGASVPGSNTTGTTGTLNGSWQFTDFEVASGQTLTIDNSNTNGFGGVLIVRCTGTYTMGGTIAGGGKFYRDAADFRNAISIGDNPNNTYTWTASGAHGANSGFGNINTYPFGLSLNSNCFGPNVIENLNRQGMGGPNNAGNYSAESAYAGSTFVYICAGAAISSGTTTCSGANGNTAASTEMGRGGGAGGTIIGISAISITNSGTRTVAGGNGSNANGSGGGQGYGGGGGGGGAIYDIAPIVVNTGTDTVTGGTNGSNTGASGGYATGGAGGGNYGRGGGSGQAGIPSTGGAVIVMRNNIMPEDI
jgi:hypothetical protein